MGLVYLCGMLHIGSTKLGTVLIYLMALSSPILLLATAIYLPRDLIRRASRVQGIIALLLSLPAIKFVTLLRPP